MTFEKLLSVVAPGFALNRAVAKKNLQTIRNLASTGGYKGGEYGRSRPVPYGSRLAEDLAASNTYGGMIANAMDLYRNDPMAKSIVDVCSTYLGESRPTATTSDPVWNEKATKWFNEVWWGQADARNRSGTDFGEMQILWDKWCWLGGDMLFLLYDGRLWAYEYSRTPSPRGLLGAGHPEPDGGCSQ